MQTLSETVSVKVLSKYALWPRFPCFTAFITRKMLEKGCCTYVFRNVSATAPLVYRKLFSQIQTAVPSGDKLKLGWEQHLFMTRRRTKDGWCPSRMTMQCGCKRTTPTITNSSAEIVLFNNFSPIKVFNTPSNSIYCWMNHYNETSLCQKLTFAKFLPRTCS